MFYNNDIIDFKNFNSCIINTCKTGYTKSANNLSCIILEKNSEIV